MSDEQKKLLESQLWAIANILRGKISANQFQDYILGFIFYKYLSEKLEKKANEFLKPDGLVFNEIDENSTESKAILEALKDKNIVFSGVSFPKDLPNDLIINNDKSAYYRLHGVPVLFKSEYSEEELKKLAKEIKKARQEVFVFFNNTWGTAALTNALYLKKLLE